MKPYYQDDFVTIYHGDCREVLPVLSFDLILTDPPYGMGNNTDSTRFTGGNHARGEGRDDYPTVHGDSEPFDPSHLTDFERVVIWGANHFAQRLEVGTWLVWVKKPEHLYGTFLSDCELAWMKGGAGSYAFSKPWSPPARAQDYGASGQSPAGIHPNQKPVALMSWCIDKAKLDKGSTVCDPYAGSGSTGRAAKDRGMKAILIELEEEHCETSARRMEQEVLMLDA